MVTRQSPKARCVWCRQWVTLFRETDTLWSLMDPFRNGPLLQCPESMLWPQTHLPAGPDGWFPRPKYWGIEWH